VPCLVAIILFPMKQLVELGTVDNGEQLDRLSYVLRNTAPDAGCLDGWTGMGVFRPHSWFFWFLHDEIAQLIPYDDRIDFEESVRSGAVKPAMIFVDDHLLEVLPEIMGSLRQDYEPTPKMGIWRRRAS